MHMPSLPSIAARMRGRRPSRPKPRTRRRLATIIITASILLLLVVPSVVMVAVVLMSSVDDASGGSADDAARLTAEAEQAALLRPPPSYPWHGRGSVDVDRLLRRVEEELNSETIGPRSLLYLVRDGRLWIKSSHHRLVKQIDHGLYYHFRLRPFEEMVSRALEAAKRAAHLNLEFSRAVLGPDGAAIGLPILFQWNDYGGCVDNDGYPIFAYAMSYTSTFTSDADCLTFAIPGYDAWRKYGSIDAPSSREWWDATFLKNDEPHPWRSKIPKVAWRGSSTGSVHDYPNWRDLPRARLVLAGMERPDVLDVGFTSIVQRNASEARAMEGELVGGGGHGGGGMRGRIPFRGFMRYRAVLDIDGNSWSTRFADLLCQSSVVVKVEPSYAEYFFQELRPWVHYVPVHANLSNLVDVATYVVSDANQDQIRRIVKAANGWCAAKMTPSRMVSDTMWILRSYSEALSDSGSGRGGDADPEDWRRGLEEIWARWVRSGTRGGGGGATAGDYGGGMTEVGGQLSTVQEAAAIAGIYALKPLLGMGPFVSFSSSSASTRLLLSLSIVLSLFFLGRSFAAVFVKSTCAIFGVERKCRSE